MEWENLDGLLQLSGLPPLRELRINVTKNGHVKLDSSSFQWIPRYLNLPGNWRKKSTLPLTRILPFRKCHYCISVITNAHYYEENRRRRYSSFLLDRSLKEVLIIIMSLDVSYLKIEGNYYLNHSKHYCISLKFSY